MRLEFGQAHSHICCKDLGCLPIMAACRTTQAFTPATTIAYDPNVE
jgi:hypothetical protein